MERALSDAVKAQQAEKDEAEPGGIRWIVPGRIEEEQMEGRSRSSAA